MYLYITPAFSVMCRSDIFVTCNLANIKNVSAADFFTVKLEFYWWKMDLHVLDIKLNLGVSEVILEEYIVCFQCLHLNLLKAAAAQFHQESLLKTDPLH